VTYEVSVSLTVAARAAERYPGEPSELDFWAGPLAGALLAFRRFDDLPYPDVPAVRIYLSVDPAFGALVFTGVSLGPGRVEIAAFDEDPDYRDLVGDDDP
jgi:hypothetical protein